MKISTKLLYFNVAVLATLSLTNHVVAMEEPDKKAPPRPPARAALKKSSPVAALIASVSGAGQMSGQPIRSYTKSSKKLSTQKPSSPNVSPSAAPSFSKNEDVVVKKKPNPKSAQSSQRKRFDPPTELSHEELKSIFTAPFESTSPFLSRYTDDLQTRDNLRNKSHTDRMVTLKTTDSEFLLTTGIGENSARVLLQDKSTFASLKETRTGRTRVGNLIPTGKFVAVLDDIETRSLSTMGEDYASVFGVYNLYDETTGKPVTYTHEVSPEERPIRFRIAFSQEKVEREE